MRFDVVERLLAAERRLAVLERRASSSASTSYVNGLVGEWNVIPLINGWVGRVGGGGVYTPRWRFVEGGRCVELTGHLDATGATNRQFADAEAVPWPGRNMHCAATIYGSTTNAQAAVIQVAGGGGLYLSPSTLLGGTGTLSLDGLAYAMD